MLPNISEIPRVLLAFENRGSYGRRATRGAAAYIRENGPWDVYNEFNTSGEDLVLDMFPTPDGVLTQQFNTPLIRRLKRMGVPCVLAFSEDKTLGLPSVSEDNEAIGRMGAGYLLDRGFRRLAFAGMGNAGSRAREAGLTEAARRRGVGTERFEIPLDSVSAEHFREAQRSLGEWIASLPQPIGVMTYNDSIGRRVVALCRAQGIPVPESVAVLGVDNDEIPCSLSIPELSSIDHGSFQVGYRAAELLDQLLSGRPVKAGIELIPPQAVITRGSTETLAIEDPLVAEALRFVRGRYQDGITVEHVLESVVVSRSKLDRAFKFYLGRTVSDEIERLQMERAKELLCDLRLPVLSIAHRCGFRHRQQFNVNFRRATGLTPKRYREQHAIG